MSVFEGKSPAERNKIIAAIVLGVLAFLSLAYTFGGLFLGGKSNSTASDVPSPTKTASTNGTTSRENAQNQISAPSEAEINSNYTGTPINFNGNKEVGGIGGRNIFAFYEPGKLIPQALGSPTVVPENTVDLTTPIPVPTPPVLLSFVSPQSKYAGEKAFTIKANGEKFTSDMKIVYNGTPLQTTFVNEGQLTATVPATFISTAGFGQIIVDTFDGKNYSNAISFNVQAPPTPTVEYVGMIARRHRNNDTAYFEKKGSKKPIDKRLNDVVDGRFKLVSISEKEVKLEDIRLGFRHSLAMKRPDPSTITNEPSIRPGRNRRRPTRNRRRRNSTTNNTNCVPGIPCNIPRSTPRRRPNRPNPNSNVKRP